MLLFRPVGFFELEKIQELKFKCFPPRFETQPIFYPVLNEGYAIQIAKDWNTKDNASGFVGYVTRFEVDDAYVSKFERQVVGDRSHEELWIPSEELEEFNAHIVGKIEVIHTFSSLSYLQSWLAPVGGECDPTEWQDLMKRIQSWEWFDEEEIECHSHCMICWALLCTEHSAKSGFDFPSGYCGVNEMGNERFLCPPCFEVLAKEYGLVIS